MKMNIIKKAAGIMPFMALAATFVTSCSSDNLAEGSQQSTNSEAKTVTFTATVEGNDASTRVGFSKGDNNTAKFYWNNGDAITVLATTLGDIIASARFTTSCQNGSTEASFSMKQSSGLSFKKYAAYPNKQLDDTNANSSGFVKASGGVYNVYYTLRSNYKYTKVESNIFPKDNAYPVNNTEIPLFGTISGDKITFNHVGGLAVIRVDNMPVTEGTLTVSADQKLSGSFYIYSFDKKTDRKIETSETSTESEKKVTFEFSGATEGQAGVFYLPLATGDYTNVKVELNNKENSTLRFANLSELTIARAQVTAIPVYNRIVNGHKFIDLGLSVLWADMNVGAEKVSDFGGLFAWGETKAKTSFSWDNYELGKYENTPKDYGMKKYNATDKLTTLENKDDAAYVNWGSPCHMPTYAELDELYKGCTLEYTKIDEVEGVKVTSNKAGYTNNWIFLPYPDYSKNGDPNKDNYSSAAILWSNGNMSESSDNVTQRACKSFRTSYSGMEGAFARYVGLSIRAVVTK